MTRFALASNTKLITYTRHGIRKVSMVEETHMTPLNRKLQAATLAAALLLPAGTAVAQVSWSKPDSRTKGTVIGAVAGGLVAGKKGAIAGAVLGNGVQAYRHSHHRVAHRHRRHHRR